MLLFQKNDVWNEKKWYSGSNHVYYKYYLNSSKCLFFYEILMYFNILGYLQWGKCHNKFIVHILLCLILAFDLEGRSLVDEKSGCALIVIVVRVLAEPKLGFRGWVVMINWGNW